MYFIYLNFHPKRKWILIIVPHEHDKGPFNDVVGQHYKFDDLCVLFFHPDEVNCCEEDSHNYDFLDLVFLRIK